MKKYKTIQVVHLFSGKLALSEKQAKDRGPALKAMGDGIYEIIGPVTFKAGEIIGMDPISKPILKRLEKQAAIDATAAIKAEVLEDEKDAEPKAKPAPKHYKKAKKG